MGNKIKTVIVSVLKPVDDTRMYEKLGLSLQQTNRYDVNIIGFRTKNLPEDERIQFYPLFDFGRKSIQRLFATFKVILLIIKIQPELFIFTTYELIPAAWLYKKFYPSTKLIYDVQENYALNIISNRAGDFKSKLIAKFIRILETKFQQYVSLNYLAEICYVIEMPFLEPKLILLNKYKALEKIDLKTSFSKPKHKFPHYPVLTFSGTISHAYGIGQSLDLVNKLAKYFPNILGKFVGHVTDSRLLNILLKIKNPLFQFTIDHQPISHSIILEEMRTTHFGLVAHQPTMSIKNCFPTRIYELMAHEIPIILQDHEPWKIFCTKWDSCLVIDYNNFDAQEVARQMETRQFYSRGNPTDIYWESEEEKLIEVTNTIFNIND